MAVDPSLSPRMVDASCYFCRQTFTSTLSFDKDKKPHLTPHDCPERTEALRVLDVAANTDLCQR